MIDKSKVKVLQVSKPFPQCPWVIQCDLDPKLRNEIKQAFYNLKEEAILKPLKANGFAPITDEDYARFAN